MSPDEWMDQRNVALHPVGWNSALKRKDALTQATTSMQREDVVLSKLIAGKTSTI